MWWVADGIKRQLLGVMSIILYLGRHGAESVLVA
jgi:hypothetical protein